MLEKAIQFLDTTASDKPYFLYYPSPIPHVSLQVPDSLVDQYRDVFEEEPLRALVKQRELAVYEHDDFWQCMDTYRDWQLLNGLLADGKAPWEIW